MSAVSSNSSSLPMTFDAYLQKLKQTLSVFEEFFQDQANSFEPELKDVVTAVLEHKGKRLRPGFVFASAGIFSSPTPQALRLASIVEFIHLATLVHDDILDNADTRHAATAHHRLFSPQISVLTGDTLFLRANELAAMEDDIWVGRVVSAAAKAVCTGEISQSLSARTKEPLSLAEYERQILFKTGKLFGLSCALGGYLAKLTEAERQKLALYGELFGVSYQLYDDAVDIWGSEADFKKTLRTDQLQRKWTLPWILLASKIDANEIEICWQNSGVVLSAFEKFNIWLECSSVIESYLDRAESLLEGFENANLLKAPLSFIRQAWAKLAPNKRAINE